MEAELSERLQALFDAALELEPGQRRAFLSEACGEDLELRARLESLLRCHERGERFLEDPVLGRAVRLDPLEDLARDGAAGAAPRRIGPYVLEKLIGSGGMASVYLASRKVSEFTTRVAIKVIRPGMASEEVIRRFRTEGLALAKLLHPNVARLLDGGSTEEQLPYLVMEYVEGEPISTWCEQRKLSSTQRLELFRTVCSAVAFAHQNLVLHRDLKPANIFVTAQGETKLLDFGISKLLDPEAASSPATVTSTAHRFFTPQYASPEQVRGEAVSTATDVYSLGVILYELLTGRLPYALTGRSPLEIERIVCEEEPPRPSLVAGASPKRRRSLAGDLDTIVLKALRKEPERRYASVEQLSEDIRRHLAGLPVAARKDTLRYRTRKFLRRHRVAVLVLGLVLLSLVSGTFFAVRDARRARRQQLAVQEVRSFLVGLYTAEAESGFRSTRDRVLETLTAGSAERLAAELYHQPEELVAFTESVGRICDDLYLRESAVRWWGKALAAREEAFGADARGLVGAELRLAIQLRETGQLSRAEAELRKTGALLDASGASDAMRAKVDHELALVLWDQGDFDQPLRLFRDAVERLHGAGGASVAQEVSLVADFARFLAARGDLREAEGLLGEALQTAGKAAAGEREVLRGEVEHALGVILWNTPRFRDAEPLLRGALAAFGRRLGSDDPRRAACLDDLARLIAYLRPRGGTVLRFAEWAPLWREGWERRVLVFGDGSLEAAGSLHTLSQILTEQERETLALEVLDVYRKRFSENHPQPARALVQLGLSLDRPQEGDLRRGEEHLRQALRILGKKLSSDHWEVARTSGILGTNLLRQGLFADAEPLLVRSAEVLERSFGPGHPWTISALASVVGLYEGWGARLKAEPYRRRVEAAARSWPYARAARDCDDSMEDHVSVDFEDDHVEKVLVVGEVPRNLSHVRLWVYGSAYNNPGATPSEREDSLLEVNHGGEAQTLAFNAGARFVLVDCYQWVPFEVPVAWLRAGRNTFSLDKRHDPEYRRTHSWKHDNVEVGIDRGQDHDRSWWFSSGKGCCARMGDLRSVPKPLLRSDPLIRDHREAGFKECEGELMVFLEL